jgi:hypothetical protein
VEGHWTGAGTVLREYTEVERMNQTEPLHIYNKRNPIIYLKCKFHYSLGTKLLGNLVFYVTGGLLESLHQQ